LGPGCATQGGLCWAVKQVAQPGPKAALGARQGECMFTNLCIYITTEGRLRRDEETYHPELKEFESAADNEEKNKKEDYEDDEERYHPAAEGVWSAADNEEKNKKEFNDCVFACCGDDCFVLEYKPIAVLNEALWNWRTTVL